eukprot:GHVS01077487.1.p1 GENE.GHVS01077487.1~~GHVS01077487.1.p1  ORF type:complete len:492 (-),score=56.47 GHVS01077487.1:591-2066(-)
MQATMLFAPPLPSLVSSTTLISQTPSEPSTPILFSPTSRTHPPSSSFFSSSALQSDSPKLVSFAEISGSTGRGSRGEEERGDERRNHDKGAAKEKTTVVVDSSPASGCATEVDVGEKKRGEEDEGDAKVRSPAIASKISMALSICMYSCVSLGIVFLNRKIFADSFQFPIFVSWLQQVVGLSAFQFFSFLSSRISFLSPIRPLFPTVSFRWAHMKAVFPLSLAFVGMIGFSNICLQHVQISTYQVARALTLLLNLLLSYAVLNTRVSVKAGCACGLVISGFLVGSMDPMTLSFIGVCTGVMASLFQAIYMVQIKRSLVHLNNDQNTLLWYNLLLSSVIFFPVIFIAGERNFFTELPLSISHPSFLSIWSLLISSGLTGILLTMSTYWCVRVTSPVTYNIVGYAKACLQSLAAIVVLGDIVTFRSALGILLTLCGSFWYSRTKMVEMEAETAGRATVMDSVGENWGGEKGGERKGRRCVQSSEDNSTREHIK